MNGMYRTDVYFLSKTIAELPIFIIIPVIFTSVSYYLVGFNPDPNRFMVAVAVVMLVANVATSFGNSIYYFQYYYQLKVIMYINPAT